MEATYELPCVEGQAAFADPRFPSGGGTAHSLYLVLRLGGVAARMPLAVHTEGGNSIVDFFAGLASDWKGWDGSRTWYDDAVRSDDSDS